MKKYLRFEIGDRVLVKAFVGFGAERNKEKVITERVMDRVVLDKPREGDITGAGYRHLGVIHTGGSYYSLEGTEYESGYLEIKKTYTKKHYRKVKRLLNLIHVLQMH